MKITLLIFVYFAFISVSFAEDSGPLISAFEYLTEAIKSTIEKKSYGKYVNKIDFECAKESLNLYSNGQKLVNEVQAIIISVGAYVKCLKTNKEETLDFATKLVIEEYGISDDVDAADFNNLINDCYKLKLQEIEPNSKLLDGFNSTSSEFCKYASIDELVDHTIKPIEQQIGPIKTATCGAADKNLVANFLIKFNLIPAEKRVDISREETQKMVDLFRDRIVRASDCIMKNI